MITPIRYRESLNELPTVLDSNIHWRTPRITIIPGSFNPLHQGHIFLYQTNPRSGDTPTFELSVLSVYKEPIEYNDLINRIKSISDAGFSYIVTNTPRIFDKLLLIQDHFNVIDFDCTVKLGSDVFERFLKDEGEDAVDNCGSYFEVYRRDVALANVQYFDTPANLRGLSSTKLRSK